MSFEIIFKKNKRRHQYNESFELMKRGISHKKNDIGFAEEAFIPVKAIDGIIQQSQIQSIDFKGEESNPIYVGYFLPNFILDTDEIAEYRIKYTRPHEILILKITEYNPNLFLKGERDHIQLKLILEKKYQPK